MKNYIPGVMSLFLVVAVISAVTLRVIDESGFLYLRLLQPVPILGFLYVLWIAIELKISLDEPQKGSVDAEKVSVLLYPMSQAAVLITALVYGSNRFAPSVFIGLMLAVFGILFRLYAVRTLGKYYSHMVRIQQDHRIVNAGPYRFVRHPAYLGMIASHIGIVIALFNPISALLLCFGLVPGVLLRIHNEEKTLSFIPEYTDFSRTRKRLIPFVW